MAMSDNLRGVGLMCLSMAAFTINDSFMKSVTADVPLFQVIFLRGLIATAGLIVYGLWTRSLHHPVAARDWRVIGLRSVAEIFATLTFLMALVHMPLANLSAILQFMPLAVTLGAALVFGEKVGWRRLLAISVGFAGVLIIIRPGTDHFDFWSVLGVLSVLCVVIRDLSIRRLSPVVPSVVVALGAALSVLAMGLVLSLVPADLAPASFAGMTGWKHLLPAEAAKILGAGSFLVIGYLCAVTAMRWGEIGVVAPFRYTSLLWALLLGLFVFGQFPDGTTLVGAALVVASGLYTLFREASLRRRPKG